MVKHTNRRALIEGTWDYSFAHHKLSSDRGPYSFSEQEMHDHYAANALAAGHGPDCLLVSLPVNWPTLVGRPGCSCLKENKD